MKRVIMILFVLAISFTNVPNVLSQSCWSHQTCDNQDDYDDVWLRTLRRIDTHENILYQPPYIISAGALKLVSREEAGNRDLRTSILLVVDSTYHKCRGIDVANADTGIYIYDIETTGIVADVTSQNGIYAEVSGNGNGISAKTTSSGQAIYGKTEGSGKAGYFVRTVASGTEAIVSVFSELNANHNGLYSELHHSNNTQDAIVGKTLGSGAGVRGQAENSASAHGVEGLANAGYGVYGSATTGKGVYGVASGSGGYGIYGTVTNTGAKPGYFVDMAGSTKDVLEVCRSSTTTTPEHAALYVHSANGNVGFFSQDNWTHGNCLIAQINHQSNTTGVAAAFNGWNAAAMWATSSGSPYTAQIINYGPGPALYLQGSQGQCLAIRDSAGNNNDAVDIEVAGNGEGIDVEITNASSTANAIHAKVNNVSGKALYAEGDVYATSDIESTKRIIAKGFAAYYTVDDRTKNDVPCDNLSVGDMFTVKDTNDDTYWICIKYKSGEAKGIPVEVIFTLSSP